MESHFDLFLKLPSIICTNLQFICNIATNGDGGTIYFQQCYYNQLIRAHFHQILLKIMVTALFIACTNLQQIAMMVQYISTVELLKLTHANFY